MQHMTKQAHRYKLIILLVLPAILGLGCHHFVSRSDVLPNARTDEDVTYRRVKYKPEVWNIPEKSVMDPLPQATEEPWSLRTDLPEQYLDLTLEQALEIALMNAKILNDLGGTILTAPSTVRTIHDPSVAESDPQLGIDAALSQFDARLNSLGVFQNNDRPINNFFLGGGSQLFQQDYHDYNLELTKKTAVGTQVSARGLMDYDNNNRSQNLYPSSWGTQIEMEVRQPLMQGAGVDFNRIAGPNGRPGSMGGIVVARINTDIAVTDFEMGLRDFISNVENAYWDLFFAYRLLDTTLEARDQSLKIWKSTISRIDQKGITAAKEAQAREQYFRFEAEMKDALAGRMQNATQTRNGSQPGTFTASGGLYVAERRLRLLLGLPMKEELVIRPVSEPKIAPVEYEWSILVDQAIAQRPELSKQRQVIKSLELQKDASKQFTKPRLDMFGRYRFRGFGDELIGSTDEGTELPQGATENLFGGDFQEWELGVEMSVPLGFREGNSAVRNLELKIARERARLHEQERQILHDLSNALADLSRAQELNQLSYNRLIAAQQRLSSLNEDIDSPDEILDAQVRLAEARRSYFRSLVDHESAMRNIHYEKGSLLAFRRVILADHSGGQQTHWEQTSMSQAELNKIVPAPAALGDPELNPPKLNYSPVSYDEEPSGSIRMKNANTQSESNTTSQPTTGHSLNPPNLNYSPVSYDEEPSGPIRMKNANTQSENNTTPQPSTGHSTSERTAEETGDSFSNWADP